MKNLILIAFLCLINSVPVLCQDGFSFGANVNGIITATSAQSNSLASSIQTKGAAGFGYSIGAQAVYTSPIRLFLRGGLSFQQLGHPYRLEGLVFETNILNGTESTARGNTSIQSLVIPLEIGYSIPSKKGKINYLIGISEWTSIHLGSKEKLKIFHEQIPDEEFTIESNQIEATTYSVGVFGGIEMPMNDRWVLGIEPNIRYSPKRFPVFTSIPEIRSLFESGLTLSVRWAK